VALVTSTDTLDCKLPPEDDAFEALRRLAGLTVALGAAQAALEHLGRLEHMALKRLFRLAIYQRRAMLALTHLFLAFFVLAADLYEHVLTLIRLARSVPPSARTHLRVLLAVRHHYGHRFEQNDDGFWLDPQPVLRGAVCALS
jgi:hypothetical protein